MVSGFGACFVKCSEGGPSNRFLLQLPSDKMLTRCICAQEADEVDPDRKQQRILLALLLLLAAIAIASLGYPIYVIRPFRAQGEHELALSLLVRRWSVDIASVCAALSALVAFVLWRRTGPRLSILIRGSALVLLLVTAATAVLTRVNIFEKMFHPVSAANFVSADHASIKDSEMVLAMAVGDQQRAYPISIMAYHHILNDVLAGVPLAVTY
jgi:hypothetical protein